jgi:IS30 family transposase
MNDLEKTRKLHQKIHKALMNDWDPIGVYGIPEAQDEYDSYIPTIYKFLFSRKPAHELFDYLWWLETEHMGLTGDYQKTKDFAEKLLKLV